MRQFLFRLLILATTVGGLGGCASQLPVTHAVGQLYVPEKNPEYERLRHQGAFVPTSWSGSLKECPPAGTTKFLAPASHRKYLPSSRLPRTINLSKGDVVNLTVHDGKDFNGDYVISQDGTINIPYLGKVRATGQTEQQVERAIRRGLVRRKLFPTGFSGVSLRVIQYAAIQVSVTGAVFFPGFVTLNERLKSARVLERRTFGDNAIRRKLNFALKGAYGVRPDADLSSVLLKRRGKIYQFNMQGTITGHPVDNPMLEEGDEVFVPSTGCFQTALVRPSTVTPRGIRLFVSKMAKGQGPDARYDETMPYGVRLLRGAIIADCVGGATASNGRRYVVLVSNNPITNKTEVIQRSVEELVRRSHRDEINPVLMPNDGIACYDSNFTEILSFMSYLSGVTSTARTLFDN